MQVKKGNEIMTIPDSCVNYYAKDGWKQVPEATDGQRKKEKQPWYDARLDIWRFD